MAERKRRGPGRPPKRRGPGRPPGSKDKVKRRIRPSVAARLASRPKRGPGRPRKAQLPTVPTEMTIIARDDTRFDNLRAEIGASYTAINRRLVEAEKKLAAMIADSEHPTTRMLAMRLITLETSEKITHGTHERLTQVEEELRALRRDLGEIIREQHEERNRADVAKLATEEENEQPSFDDGNWRKGRTASGSEM